jgi:hypothetical protein
VLKDITLTLEAKEPHIRVIMLIASRRGKISQRDILNRPSHPIGRNPKLPADNLKPKVAIQPVLVRQMPTLHLPEPISHSGGRPSSHPIHQQLINLPLPTKTNDLRSIDTRGWIKVGCHQKAGEEWG